MFSIYGSLSVLPPGCFGYLKISVISPGLGLVSISGIKENVLK